MGRYVIKTPKNEKILQYIAGSKERLALEKEIKIQENNVINIPIIIDGKKIFKDNKQKVVLPHDHSKHIANYSVADKSDMETAIKSALSARKSWANTPIEERAAIFLKAADLLTVKYREKINAATMLSQSKTIYQAEIDAVCELADFWRFNVFYMYKLMKEQPYSPDGMWNRLDYRGLEGFVFAVPPFNFTSISGNLPTAPALMGNTVIWKPASTAVYSSYFVMEILLEAGLPDGVINFVSGSGVELGPIALNHKDLAGVHFTGSVNTLKFIWKTVGQNIDIYKTYPRIVGEAGGKDFIFAYKDTDKYQLMTALLRGAFEYQGQKCSAASRAYIPKTIWKDMKDEFLKQISTIKMGDPKDFNNFISAVIDKKSFDKISGYIEKAKNSKDAEIIIGGNCDDSKGYFIEPTVILVNNPHFLTMEEEIFGPVLSIYVYDEKDFEKTINILKSTSIFALTGAIFAKDRKIIEKLSIELRDVAGNFYINDKPTGAVVGQQPFGGARSSGTNDKAGSILNLLRWTSPRAIKETFIAPTEYKYPYMN